MFVLKNEVPKHFTKKYLNISEFRCKDFLNRKKVGDLFKDFANYCKSLGMSIIGNRVLEEGTC